jgi:hypothetical protein
MKRTLSIGAALVGTAALLWGFLSPEPVAAQADRRPTRAERAEEAAAAFDRMAEAYLNNDWVGVEETSQELRRTYRLLDPADQRIYRDLSRGYEQFSPDWWEHTMSPAKTEFPAEIWGKRFLARYEPSGALGFQGVRATGEYVRTREGYEYKITNLEIFVTWKPNLVNNPDPAGGALSKRMGYTLSDLAEVIVWHELGHNFMTGSLSVDVNVELYTNYQLLYSHLQEFFADLTALYHTSPRARRAVLQLRLNELDRYDEAGAHNRAAHGIGALLLADVLKNRDQWPSIHLPPTVPKQQTELNTIIYMYENWEKDWSLDEALRLRELAREFVKERGDKTFRAKGEFDLGNGTSFSLMVSQDRKHQTRRDAWVSKKLAALIEQGKTDTLEAGEKYAPRVRKKPGGIVIISSDEAKKHPRIDIPW